MKQKVSYLFSKMSLFWRYFFLLVAVMGVFLVALTTVTREFTKELQNSYMEQAQSNFEQNCELFSRELFLTHSLPASVEDSDDYLTALAAPRPLAGGDVLYMTSVHKSFSMQCSLLDLPGESFLYFRKNQTCLTRYRVFQDAEECFGSYIMYEDGAEILDELRAPGHVGLRLLPARVASVGGKTPDSYLTLIVANNDAAYGFLYPEDVVLEQFQMDSLPQDTYLEITGGDGTMLFSHGTRVDRPNDYIRLSARLSALSSTASIGIPRSYFQQTLRGVQTTVRIVCLVSVILGMLLCVLFSHISVKPFRRLLQAHLAEPAEEQPGNELLAIDTFMKTAWERNKALRSMLLSSLLVRAFSGLSISEEEFARVSAAFPIFRKALRAAIVRDRAPNPTIEDPSALISILREALPEPFLCEYINLQESIILFPDEPEAYEHLQEFLLELNQGPEREARFVCGVSTPFEGLSEIGPSIRQAQFCLPEKGERMIVHAGEAGALDAPSESVSFDLKQFQQALAGWNRDEMLLQIDRLASFVGKSDAIRPEELFYSILFLLRDTAHSGKISFEAYEKMTYQHASAPAANLRRLKGIVRDLFEQKAALQLSDKQLLCQEIVQYIKDSFFDASLCMASVSKRFCVSERFVYNAIQDQTGTNMSTLLTRIRMEEAARLLRETEESVSSIAVRCGYPVESTFYRNFKKYYQLTPAEYKNAGHQTVAK